MANQQWEHEYYNTGGKKWWDVRKPNSPFPNYFIVEDVGDPNDGDHLVSLLNEREGLIHENADLRKQVAAYEGLLRQVVNNAPSEQAVAGYTWAWKYNVVVERIKALFERLGVKL